MWLAGGLVGDGDREVGLDTEHVASGPRSTASRSTSRVALAAATGAKNFVRLS